jgi:hypothetical protein
MSNRYIVGPGYEFAYPADAASEKLVKFVGGRSKLTAEQAKDVKYKVVTEGQDCSDMPSESLKLYLERGWVIESISKTPVIVPVEKGEDDE